LQLWDEVNADIALYVGDDLTDEHAFQVAARRPLVAARIGSSTRSGAGYVLRSQSDIDDLLALLVELRCGAPLARGVTPARPRARSTMPPRA
jgi:trehalose 6-phosphate phosphatase